MFSMQYRVALPSDYDMDIIKERVRSNGYKTDKFDSLLFKMYLISEEKNLGTQNEYSPLYVWKDAEGMNKFLFEGYYDNILKSFGWQQVTSNVVYEYDVDIKQAKYVILENKTIEETKQLRIPSFSDEFEDCLGSLTVYNTNKWTATKYYFFENKPVTNDLYNVYQVLHTSSDN